MESLFIFIYKMFIECGLWIHNYDPILLVDEYRIAEENYFCFYFKYGKYD